MNNPILSATVFMILILSSFPAMADDNGPSLKPGLYLSYYQEEKDAGYSPSTNVINADGTGVFEQKDEGDVIYTERFRWKVTENTLILENFEVLAIDSATGRILGAEEPYTQFFEILEIRETQILLRLRKDVYANGSETIFDRELDSDAPYIWDYMPKESK